MDIASPAVPDHETSLSCTPRRRLCG